MKRFFSSIIAIFIAAGALFTFTSCMEHPTQARAASQSTVSNSEAIDPAIIGVTDEYDNNVQKSALWVMNADGSHKTTIYTSPSIKDAINLIGEPTWSPDGKHIAFTRYISGNGSGCVTGLYTCDFAVVNGMPMVQNANLLVSGVSWTMPVTWNPNPENNEIVFTTSASNGTNEPNETNDSKQAIEAIPATGGTPVVLYTAPANHTVRYPSYSPDGSQVAFEDIDRSVSPAKYSIVIMNRATRTVNETISLNQLSEPDPLQWSHHTGDTRIAFGAVLSDGTCGIYTVDAANPSAAPVQVVTPSTQYCSTSTSSSFSWSPDDSDMLIGNISSNHFAHVHISSGSVSMLASTADGKGQFDWRRF